MSYHPEALPIDKQVGMLLSRLAGRVRNLEARMSAIPVMVLPAAPVSTTSAVFADLWAVPRISAPDGWTVTITLNVTGTGELQLVDVDGFQQDWAAAQNQVTLTANTPGPFTIQGLASAGTLTTRLTAASTAPWSVRQDD